MSDISISRKHAKIEFKDGGFILTDKDSKFGTSVKLQGPMKIIGIRRAVQIGKHALSFKLRQK